MFGQHSRYRFYIDHQKLLFSKKISPNRQFRVYNFFKGSNCLKSNSGPVASKKSQTYVVIFGEGVRCEPGGRGCGTGSDDGIAQQAQDHRHQTAGQRRPKSPPTEADGGPPFAQLSHTGKPRPTACQFLVGSNCLKTDSGPAAFNLLAG
jgi:hypothetical protein